MKNAEIEKHLLAGLKPKKVQSMMKGVKIEEIYKVAQSLRKAGKLGPGVKAAPVADDFRAIAQKEQQFLTGEIERLIRLAAAYDQTNSEFAADVEKRIDKRTAQKAAIDEYLNNH